MLDASLLGAGRAPVNAAKCHLLIASSFHSGSPTRTEVVLVSEAYKVLKAQLRYLASLKIRYFY